MNDGKKPDYAIIVPDTRRAYRQDDGRYLGPVAEVFPKVAEQVAAVLASRQKSDLNGNSEENEDAGFEYIWVSSCNLTFPLSASLRPYNLHPSLLLKQVKSVLTVYIAKQERSRAESCGLEACRWTGPVLCYSWPAGRWKVHAHFRRHHHSETSC